MQNKRPHFDVHAFIAKNGGTLSKYPEREAVFAQGDPADALFYIVAGSVKATTNSEVGKEAVIAMFESRDFFGERCLRDDEQRAATVMTTSASEIARFDRDIAIRALSEDSKFASICVHFILERNYKLQASLIDRLFNSSEKRLARVLWTLANGSLAQANVIPASINQEMLASMVGTTRSRINQFMNKFRKLGYIDYNGKITINDSLMNQFLRGRQDDDQPEVGAL